MLAKSLTFLAGADAAGIVLGARVPIILTSRADSVATRLASCAVAALVAEARRDEPEGGGGVMRDAIARPQRRLVEHQVLAVRAGRRRAGARAARPGRRHRHRAALRREGRRRRDRLEPMPGPRARGSATTARSSTSSPSLRGQLDGHAAARRRPSRRARRPELRAAGARRSPTVLADLEKLVPLAPLHQPHNLAPIAAARSSAGPSCRRSPASTPRSTARSRALAQMFALPRELTDAGVRRYGFHGLSYEYIAARAAASSTRPPPRGRTVVAHLGNGASLCALAAGRSVATTMGFTALDGLPMGTRCGALDPGVLLYLMDQRGMDARAIERAALQPVGPARRVGPLQRHARAAGERTSRGPRWPSISSSIASAASSARSPPRSAASTRLVFTGGIGENSAAIRARVCRDAAWLGVALDEQANRARRAAHQQRHQQDRRLCRAHQRGIDDRHACLAVAGLKLNGQANGTAETKWVR